MDHIASHIGSAFNPNDPLYHVGRLPSSLLSSSQDGTPAGVTPWGGGISVTGHGEPLLKKEDINNGRSKDAGHTGNENNSSNLSMKPMLEALNGISGSSSAQRLNTLTTCGNLLFTSFVQFHVIQDLDMAIDCRTQVVSLTPDTHPFKPDALCLLGASHLLRFQHSKIPLDINKAIEYEDRATLLVPDSDARKPGILTELGSSHLARFVAQGELSDASDAVRFYDQAVQLIPDGHMSKPHVLDNLGSSYARRFASTDEPSDIDKALECHVRAVSLTADFDASKPYRLTHLGCLHSSRFKRLGAVEDITAAIEYQALAVSLTPDYDSWKPARLRTLALSYASRFDRSGELSDIKTAIEHQAQMLSLIPDGHAVKPGTLSDLGDLYLQRFQRHGDVPDVNNAIDCHIHANSLTPHYHIHKPVILKNLGIAYRSRFECLGELSDIDNSIQCEIQVLLSTPDGHEYKPARLTTLGNSYFRRFEHLGELPDLDRAIDHQKKALLLAPEGNEQRPASLTNLGNSYNTRFRHTGEISDLDKSIEYQTEALGSIPAVHELKPFTLSHLGGSYLHRFKSTGKASDLNDAIQYQTQALSLIPEDHARKPQLVYNLGFSYKARFGALHDLSDLNTAIKYLTQAASLYPDGHTGKFDSTGELGWAYLHRYHHQPERQDVDLAISCFQEAAQATIGPPRARFRMSLQWARSSSGHEVPAFSAYHNTIQLLPQLVWLGITINERYKLITEIANIATEAASYAIATKEYDAALEWLEAGRSIVWSQILQLRTSFDDLSSKDPVLSNRLKMIARELEQAGSRSSQLPLSTSSGNELNLQTRAMRHHELASAWNKSLEQARSIPGFENFMRSRQSSELKRAAKHGAIVVINAHQTCDALIIRSGSDSILHIPLSSFSLQKAADAHGSLAPLIGRRHRAFLNNLLKASDRMKMEQSLRTLWHDLVKPVLDSLGYTQKLPADKLPHLTWCMTGPLSFLPLHAAGPYDQSQPNAFDLVVSSYSPTLSALLAPTIGSFNTTPGLLTVGQEGTAGQSHLPFIKPELEAIKDCAKAIRYSQLDGNMATVESVLNAMEQYSWVHLACHASQDSTDPAQSAFHLHDGDLRLSAITKRSFKGKGLAFLSACQTATGDNKLPDEAVHLAAGMLMAGYPSVIATMWSIEDKDGPEVAGKVYAELLKDGNMNHTGAARALHKAIEGLREKVGIEEFARWVPFIHMGQ